MKLIRSCAALAAASFLLAACGGGGSDTPDAGSAGAPTDKGNFVSVVSFGDSLSDAGSYAPATSLTGNGAAPYFGGKFTTNSPTGTVWVENIAKSLGLAITPHEVGFGVASVKCPAAAANAALAGSCTAYGQGGSRVTDPNGVGKAGGALTVPVKTQIANHLARFGNFKGNELVLMLGGANDVLLQFNGFATKATQNATDVATGKITQAQADGLNQANALAAQAEIKKAAQELVGYVRTEILGKGAKYVAVITVPDLAATPFGTTLPAAARGQLTSMVDVLNLWLRDGLNGQPVNIIDAYAINKLIMAQPASYGIANVTTPACDAAKISLVTQGAVKDGSSLFCNSTAGAAYNGLVTGASDTTWFFADGLHPTTGGHKVFSDEVLKLLKGFGWI